MILDFNRWNLYWRISTTSTLARKNFFLLGLPPPQTPVFETYSQLVPQSQGGQSRQGYINATLLFESLDRYQAFVLNQIVETVLTAGTELYMTIDYADGTYLPGTFADVRGTPWPLVLQPIANSQGVMYSNVELKLNNITVVAVPATGL